MAQPHCRIVPVLRLFVLLLRPWQKDLDTHAGAQHRRGGVARAGTSERARHRHPPGKLLSSSIRASFRVSSVTTSPSPTPKDCSRIS